MSSRSPYKPPARSRSQVSADILARCIDADLLQVLGNLKRVGQLELDRGPDHRHDPLARRRLIAEQLWRCHCGARRSYKSGLFENPTPRGIRRARKALGVLDHIDFARVYLGWRI